MAAGNELAAQLAASICAQEFCLATQSRFFVDTIPEFCPSYFADSSVKQESGARHNGLDYGRAPAQVPDQIAPRPASLP
jgi:hypothetical protein